MRGSSQAVGLTKGAELFAPYDAPTDLAPLGHLPRTGD